MYCNRCGKPIPDGSVFCNSCGAKQIQPTSTHAASNQQTAYRQQPMQQTQPQAFAMQQPTQQEYKMPKSYYIDSWILFSLCMIYGLLRLVSGLSTNSSIHIYKGVIACLASCAFIPAIKVMNNATGTLLIKIVVVIGIIIFI